MRRWILRLLFAEVLEVVRSVLIRSSFRMPPECRDCIATLLKMAEDALREELRLPPSS